MNTPEKCPKCGEEIMYYGHRFRLAGERSEERCLKVQRNQLSTKLTALESAYAECSEKMKRFRSRWLAAHQELRRTEDRVERAEERVKQLEDETARWAAAYRDLGTYKP